MSNEDRDSEGTFTRHSSITHPYHFMRNTSFPRCHLVNTPTGGADSFGRSLFPLGHGWPLWNPVGAINLPESHLKTGIRIGDVGILSQDGYFKYYFNIFYATADPIQEWCPDNLEPLHPPPERSEISVNPQQFPPGTALVSKGVFVSRISESPLDLRFKMKARDGAVIVLPEGASREDLVSTARLHPYVKKHALDWYRFFNDGRADDPLPNGTLYLITGTDRSKSWAVACSSQFSEQTGKDLIIHYQQAKTSGRWVLNPDALGRDDEESIPIMETCAVFIRGMRIAVSHRSWTKHILQNQPPRSVPHFNLLSTPICGFRAKLLTLVELWRDFPEQYRPVDTEIVFHPSSIICRILLDESPRADVAIADDQLWSSVSSTRSDGTLPEIVKQLAKLLETHEIRTNEGLVTLIPKAVTGDGAPDTRNALSRIPYRIRKAFTARSEPKKILRKIAKALPGPDYKEKPVLR